LTRNCLVSLKQYTPGEDFEVIVVDNGSSDETHTHCPIVGKNLFGQQFKYIRLESNINFGPACNLGAKMSRGYFLFFLNNDTLVTENWLPPLLKAFDEDKNLGAVGPLLLYPDNTVQHLGVTVSLGKKVLHLYAYFPCNHFVTRKKRYLQAITGAAFLITKELFFNLSCFYEIYRNGLEDVDFCIQISLGGKRMTVIPDSVIYHLKSQTPGRREHDEFNINIFTMRCRSQLNADTHLFYLDDGYDIYLTYYLSIVPALTQARKEELCKDRPDVFNLDWVMEKIALEPFWWDGYKEIFSYWIEKKNYENALSIIHKASRFFPIEMLISKLSFLSQNINSKKFRNMVAEKQVYLRQKSLEITQKNTISYLQHLIKEEVVIRRYILEWQKKYQIDLFDEKSA